MCVVSWNFTTRSFFDLNPLLFFLSNFFFHLWLKLKNWTCCSTVSATFSSQWEIFDWIQIWMLNFQCYYIVQNIKGPESYNQNYWNYRQKKRGWLKNKRACTVDTTSMNPKYFIRMYWANFCRPTAKIKQIIFEKPIKKICSPNIYASFGIFWVKIDR